LISNGANSDLRYNFYYPRWAYDDYREILDAFSADQGLDFLDYWDLIPESEFTNTAIHATPRGVSLLAADLADQIQSLLQP
jgi:lysophospholipase L1-like esterase